MAAFPFDVVAFDLDGTLADTAPDLAAALNHALGELGRPPVPTGVGARTWSATARRALLRRGLAATGEAAEDAGRARLSASSSIIMPPTSASARAVYPGARGGAGRDWRRAAPRLAICTNKPERLTQLLLDALGWSGRFARDRRRRHAAGAASPIRRRCAKRSPAPAAAAPPSSAIRSPTPTPRGRPACRSSRSASAFPTARPRSSAPTRSSTPSPSSFPTLERLRPELELMVAPYRLIAHIEERQGRRAKGISCHCPVTCLPL